VYRQSLLKWAFEGRFGCAQRPPNDVKDGELPKGWKWVKLKEVASDISDGDHQAPPKSETGIPFITISNVNKTTNKIDFSDTFKVNTDYFKNLKANRKPKIGDILYTVTGSFGIPILIDFEKDFCFQRHIGLIRPLAETNQKWCIIYCKHLKYTLRQKIQLLGQHKRLWH
jgi:type I restriction enzyme, S subunit